MSERVMMMDCGDGIRRADNGSVGAGPFAKIANYTVSQKDAGKIFSNKGATGTVIFQLPAPKPGLKFTFVVVAAQTLTIKAGTAEKINNSAANGTYSAAGTQANIGNVTVWSDGTNWFTGGAGGTWTTT